MKLLLSCISTKHSVLKEHWTQSSDQISCPLTVRGSYEKPQEDLGGMVCLIEDMGCMRTEVDLPMAAGMVDTERGVFVTTFGGIHEVSVKGTGINVRQNAVSSPLFNALHSISRTHRGYLVASTGLDLILEFDHDGEILWSWWATDHGFTHTPDGQVRKIDKTLDHRTQRYGTLSQTTHVNSAAELSQDRILASLFHQGMIISIDRATGTWQPVLEGLDHPHSIRILDENHFTVADTVRGRALLVHIDKDQGHVKEEIVAETSWLQDCRYDGLHDCWILVDGKYSRIFVRGGRSGNVPLAQFDFNPEWRLYEAHLL